MPSLLPMPHGLNPAAPTGLPSVLNNQMQPTVSPSLDADTIQKLQAIVARSETHKESSGSGQVGDNQTPHSTASVGTDAQSGLPPALACLLASATSTPLSNADSSQPSTPTSSLPPALSGLLSSTSAQPPQPSTPTSSLPPALAALLPSNLPRLSPAPTGRVNTSVASDLSPPVLEKVDSQPYMSCSHTDMTRQDESQDELESQDSLLTDREPSKNSDHQPIDHSEATIRESTSTVSEQDIAEKISMERLKSESVMGRKLKLVEEPQRKIPVVPKKKKPTYEGISDSQRMAAYITYSQKSDLEEKLAQKVPKKKSGKIKRRRAAEEMYEGMEYYGNDAERFGYDPSVEAHFMQSSSIEVGKESFPQEVSSSQEVEKEVISTQEKNQNSPQKIENEKSRMEGEKESSLLEEENENTPPIIEKEEYPEEEVEKKENSSKEIEKENLGEEEENGSSPQEEEKKTEPSQEVEKEESSKEETEKENSSADLGNEEELSDVEEDGIWLRLDGSPRRAEEKEKLMESLPEISPCGKEKQMSGSVAVQDQTSDKNAEISQSEDGADRASDADEEIVPDGSGEQAEIPGGEIQTDSVKEMPDNSAEPEDSTKPDNASQPETEQTSHHSTEKITEKVTEKESTESPEDHSEAQANSAVEEEAKMDTDIGKGDTLSLETSVESNVVESENASSYLKAEDPSYFKSESKTVFFNEPRSPLCEVMEGASQTEESGDSSNNSQEKVPLDQGKMDKENKESRENQSEMTLESHETLCDDISDSQIEGEATPILEPRTSVSEDSGKIELSQKDTNPIVDQEGSSGHMQKDQEQTSSSQPLREDSRTTKPKCVLTQMPQTVPVVLPKTAVKKSKLQGILNATTKPHPKIKTIQADPNKVNKIPFCYRDLGSDDPHYYEKLDPRLEKWDNDTSVYSVGFQMEGVNLNVPQFTDAEFIKVTGKNRMCHYLKKDELNFEKDGQKLEKRRDSKDGNKGKASKEPVEGKPKSKVKNLLDIRPDPRIAKKCKQTVGKKLDSTKKSENSSTDRAKNSTEAVLEKSNPPSESAANSGDTTLTTPSSESSAANTDSVAEVLYFTFAHNSFTMLE